jgi:predicted dehydrogenase
MKFLVIGLGSMGKRRIRCLKALDQENIIGVDIREDRRDEVARLFDVKTLESLEKAYVEFKPDAVLVCNNPIQHAADIIEAISYNCHVFSETTIIPDGMNEIISASSKKNLVVAASSTLRFKEPIKKLKSILQEERIGKVYAYDYHVGQYLKDWHPWEDIRDFFVSNPRTSGCKELLSIQLPCLNWIFGEINLARSEKATLGDLGMGIEDYYHLSIQHKTNIRGSFVIDVLACPSINSMKIFGDKGTIVWDGTHTIRLWTTPKQSWEEIEIAEEITRVEGYNEFIYEEPYIKELEEFISAIRTDRKPSYDFSEDIKVAALISELAGETGSMH